MMLKFLRLTAFLFSFRVLFLELLHHQMLGNQQWHVTYRVLKMTKKEKKEQINFFFYSQLYWWLLIKELMDFAGICGQWCYVLLTNVVNREERTSFSLNVHTIVFNHYNFIFSNFLPRNRYFGKVHYVYV